MSGQELPDIIPDHVAIIMDGNGRWAQARQLQRSDGHRAGVEALRKTLRFAQKSGIKFLTIYSFSSENWKRPKQEVDLLMSLLKEFFTNDLATLNSDNIKIRIIGERETLTPDIIEILDMAERDTSANTGIELVVAFNYGARNEITRAIRSIVESSNRGKLCVSDITEETISQHLDTNPLPDPDLIIRTGGDQRLSNFLLWQAAYAEFYFADICWPDFNESVFTDALTSYAGRQRRFGDVQ